jgi:hypothetical protein
VFPVLFFIVAFVVFVVIVMVFIVMIRCGARNSWVKVRGGKTPEKNTLASSVVLSHLLHSFRV